MWKHVNSPQAKIVINEEDVHDDRAYEKAEDAIKLAPFCREIIAWAGKLLQKLVAQWWWTRRVLHAKLSKNNFGGNLFNYCRIFFGAISEPIKIVLLMLNICFFVFVYKTMVCEYFWFQFTIPVMLVLMLMLMLTLTLMLTLIE